MPVRVGIRRVENRSLEKAVHRKSLRPRGSVAAALVYVVILHGVGRSRRFQEYALYLLSDMFLSEICHRSRRGRVRADARWTLPATTPNYVKRGSATLIGSPRYKAACLIPAILRAGSSSA